MPTQRLRHNFPRQWLKKFRRYGRYGMRVGTHKADLQLSFGIRGLYDGLAYLGRHIVGVSD